MKIVLLFVLIIAKLKCSVVSARNIETKDTVQISLPLDFEKYENITELDASKGALRYGFQKTRECPDFNKVFSCIRECLDSGYQIAHTDKKCTCACKRNRELAQYKPPNLSPINWKVTAPTTRLPTWDKKNLNKLSAKDVFAPSKDYEIYGDISFPDKSDIQPNNPTNTLASSTQSPHTTRQREPAQPGVNDNTGSPNQSIFLTADPLETGSTDPTNFDDDNNNANAETLATNAATHVTNAADTVTSAETTTNAAEPTTSATQGTVSGTD